MRNILLLNIVSILLFSCHSEDHEIERLTNEIETNYMEVERLMNEVEKTHVTIEKNDLTSDSVVNNDATKKVDKLMETIQRIDEAEQSQGK